MTAKCSFGRRSARAGGAEASVAEAASEDKADE